jgi:hypothetical protein
VSVLAGKKNYGWRRFWCLRDGSLNLDYDGFLADPDGSYVKSELRPLAELSNRPCLALLGEPGMGKSRTMQSERVAIDASVLAEGGKTLWLDLRSCGSEYRLDSKLFKSHEFALWEEGDHYLHVFLDSLDECLLQVNTVAALLVDELQDYPIERLSLRLECLVQEGVHALH